MKRNFSVRKMALICYIDLNYAYNEILIILVICFKKKQCIIPFLIYRLESFYKKKL